MTSLPLLISQLLRLLIQPTILGPVAVALVLVREVGPEWKSAFVRLSYDLVLLLLSVLLVVLLALDLASGPVA
jgi:hypothetical protein